ncbi:hypothetical protein ACFL5F_01150 [Planctomycetota bacterium]
MTFKYNFCRPRVILVVSAMSLLFAVTCNLQAAQGPSISIVTDTQMGPATRHGVSKVRLALRTKEIQIEQTISLETARGGTRGSNVGKETVFAPGIESQPTTGRITGRRCGLAPRR